MMVSEVLKPEADMLMVKMKGCCVCAIADIPQVKVIDVDVG